MSSSEGSEPSLSFDLSEASTSREEGSSPPTMQTESEALQQSLDEQNEFIYKIEHDAQRLDHENIYLRGKLEDMNDLNARQREEFDLQQEELHKIKAALHEEHLKNEANELYIDAAEESNQRLQEENEKQADMLATCIEEQKKLMDELGSRERAIDDLQVNLEKMDQLTRRYEKVITSFRNERKGWGNDERGQNVFVQNKLLRQRLSRAIKMGENSEKMCLTAGTLSSLHLLDLDIARERIADQSIASFPPVVLRLNNEKTRKRVRAICSPSDREREDTSGKRKRQTLRIRATKLPRDVTVSVSSICSPFGRLSLDTESELDKAPGAEIGGSSRSRGKQQTLHLRSAKSFGDAMASASSISSKFARLLIETDTELEKAGAEECGSRRYKRRQHEHKRSHRPYKQRKRAYRQQECQRHAQRKKHRQHKTLRNKRQQGQVNQQHQNLFQRLADDGQGKTRFHERNSKVPENARRAAQQVQSDPLYIMETDWAETNTRRSFAFFESLCDPMAGTIDGNSLGMLARKRQRCHISTHDTHTIDIEEETTNLPAKRVGIAETCSHRGRANEDTMAHTPADDSDSVNSSERNSTAECLTHKTQTNTTGVQTEHDTATKQSDRGTSPMSPLLCSPPARRKNLRSILQIQTPVTKEDVTQQKRLEREYNMPGSFPTCDAQPQCATECGSHSMSRRLAAAMTTTWREIHSLPRILKGQRKSVGLCHDLQSMEAWTARWAPLFLALGLLVYMWYSTREEELWMKANKMPLSTLRTLRNSPTRQSGWREKMNYELVQWLEIDRVARG